MVRVYDAVRDSFHVRKPSEAGFLAAARHPFEGSRGDSVPKVKWVKWLVAGLRARFIARSSERRRFAPESPPKGEGATSGRSYVQATAVGTPASAARRKE